MVSGVEQNFVQAAPVKDLATFFTLGEMLFFSWR
jgi:hypothetical protein